MTALAAEDWGFLLKDKPGGMKTPTNVALSRPPGMTSALVSRGPNVQLGLMKPPLVSSFEGAGEAFQPSSMPSLAEWTLTTLTTGAEILPTRTVQFSVASFLVESLSMSIDTEDPSVPFSANEVSMWGSLASSTWVSTGHRDPATTPTATTEMAKSVQRAADLRPVLDRRGDGWQLLRRPNALMARWVQCRLWWIILFTNKSPLDQVCCRLSRQGPSTTDSIPPNGSCGRRAACGVEPNRQKQPKGESNVGEYPWVVSGWNLLPENILIYVNFLSLSSLLRQWFFMWLSRAERNSCVMEC